mmetsp:Transcript_35289/g.70351  ORF Transcript_35289/g.70351 Transcript_35289/m.70351 type:complete len:250 (+) Transcript_35289:1290-2039(+)
MHASSPRAPRPPGRHCAHFWWPYHVCHGTDTTHASPRSPLQPARGRATNEPPPGQSAHPAGSCPARPRPASSPRHSHRPRLPCPRLPRCLPCCQPTPCGAHESGIQWHRPSVHPADRPPARPSRPTHPRPTCPCPALSHAPARGAADAFPSGGTGHGVPPRRARGSRDAVLPITADPNLPSDRPTDVASPRVASPCAACPRVGFPPRPGCSKWRVHRRYRGKYDSERCAGGGWRRPHRDVLAPSERRNE